MTFKFRVYIPPFTILPLTLSRLVVPYGTCFYNSQSNKCNSFKTFQIYALNVHCCICRLRSRSGLKSLTCDVGADANFLPPRYAWECDKLIIICNADLLDLPSCCFNCKIVTYRCICTDILCLKFVFLSVSRISQIFLVHSLPFLVFSTLLSILVAYR